jgi:hypothetical protein
MVAIFGYQLRYMTQTFPDPLVNLEEPAGDRARGERKRAMGAARQHCLRVQGRLDEFSARLNGEPEARRMASLFRGYCERFFDAPKMEAEDEETRLAWGASFQKRESSLKLRAGGEPLPVSNDYPLLLADF